MYKLFCIIIVLALSCTKEKTEPVTAVTYYVDEYNDQWQLVNTFVSIHWHSMTAAELQHYKQLYNDQQQHSPKGYWICYPEKRFMRMEIKPDYCND